MTAKFKTIRDQYGRALKKLEEILAEKENDIVRDSAIKRFEICFDLAWKSLKIRLEEEKGVICQSPKDCFREGYRQGIIDYDELWLKMTDWRNEAVHTYSEKLAKALYKKLAKALIRFKSLGDRFKGK